ncbi:MAG: right-handed parallel beta-helix repeat-containing protein [Armatimonadetes bacterium]|nr:right-handed parallel beta-helix repeat-containing protein [Armatimonadota bacterium]
MLLGGQPISGFRPYRGDILQADASAFKGRPFRQLYFEGRRQPLARYPNYDPENPYGGGWAYADGELVPMYKEVPGESKRTVYFKTTDARAWAHPEEGEVFTFPRYNWWNNLVPIAGVDAAQRLLHLTADCSYAVRPGDRYYVQGLFEELDAPGEWCLDPRTWILYFLPPEPLGERAVYAPTLRTIVALDGATHLTLGGFTIECCSGTAVTVRNSSDCLIAGNTIRNAGDYQGGGVSVDGGQRVGVVGNDIYEVGRNAISLNGGDRITLTAAEHYADNNYLHHFGVFYKQGVGVSLSGCGNRASHNLMHDGPRWGIGFSGNNHRIELNEIRHVNLETADTGAVYTGGRDWLGARGTVIRHNYFHDIIGFGWENGKWVSPHYAWGVYLDDNTGGVDVIGNIVARCVRGLVHLHNGRDNLIENNILVDGTMQQVEYNGWTPTHSYWTTHLPSMIKGYESVMNQPAWRTMRNMDIHPRDAVLPSGLIMSGNAFRRNIVYYQGENSRLFRFNNVPFERYESDHNLIWHGGRPLLTGQSKLKGESGPNLMGSDELRGEAGKLPTGWHWQERPTGANAALEQGAPPALRVDGAISKDARGEHFSILVGPEVPAVPGQAYRVTIRLRASQPEAKVGIGAQSYVAQVYFWYQGRTLSATTEWREYELLFRFPRPGEQGWNDQMSRLRFRLDFRAPSGSLWVDQITLRAAAVLDEWESWQALGFDRNSLVADPLFVDAERDNYRLRPESPAFKLGFQPIPIDEIGPYRDELRATWPITEAEGAREKPARLGH